MKAAKTYGPSEPEPALYEKIPEYDIEDLIGDLDESFSETLLRLIACSPLLVLGNHRNLLYNPALRGATILQFNGGMELF